MGFESLNEGQFFKENRVATGGRVVVWLPNDKQLPAPQLEGKNEVPSFSQEIFLVGGNYEPELVLWTPAYTTTAAWYDATDAATIVDAGGGFVSQWADKSGNVRNLFQATGSRQPQTGTRTINGLNVIDADGTQAMYSGSISLPSSGDMAVYCVTAIDSSSAGGQAFWGWNGDTYATDLRSGGSTQFDGKIKMVGSGSGPDTNFTGGPYSDSSPRIWGATYDATSAAEVKGYINGVQLAPTVAYGPALTDTGSLRAFCSELYNPVRFLDCAIGELIFVPATDDTTRQLVEGYLAWKWGLAASLPIGHPYKTIPPTI